MIRVSTGLVRGLVCTLAVASGLVLVCPTGVARAQYRDFNQALDAGRSSLRAQQYENARAPLEYALKAAGDDQSRLKAHALLCSVYFHAGQTDKVINSLDFVLMHSQSEPERNMVRGAMVNYVKHQGKTEEVIRLYEGRLNANPEDVPALYVLSDIYSKVQPNPKRATELVTKLGEVLKKSSGKDASFADPTLAGQYVKAGKAREGAAMYEQLAQNDPKMSGVYYKDAANAWLQAGDRAKALAAAKNADSSVPESRTELLEYFYHRQLGDLYLKLNEPAAAAEHFEEALAKTKIDGYAKETKKLLEQSRTLASRRGGLPPSPPRRADPGSSTATGDACSPSSAPAGKGGTVDLNKASLSQLQTVDGITEDIAIQIIDRRKSKPFESVSELIEFDGVDKATLTKVRSKLTIGAGK